MRHETPHHLISHRKHGKCNLAYKRNKIIANQKKAYKQEKENTLLVAIGAGIAVLTGIGAGLGIGKATSSAVDAIARQPEAESKISKSLLLGCALAEATAIYGFVIALLIILFLK